MGSTPSRKSPTGQLLVGCGTALTALLVIAFAVGSKYFLGNPEITVVNESGCQVTNFVLHVSGYSSPPIRLEPGESRELTVYPSGESSLWFDAVIDGREVAGLATSYIQSAEVYDGVLVLPLGVEECLVQAGSQEESRGCIDYRP